MLTAVNRLSFLQRLAASGRHKLVAGRKPFEPSEHCSAIRTVCTRMVGVVLDNMPHNATGKINRVALKRVAEARLADTMAA